MTMHPPEAYIADDFVRSRRRKAIWFAAIVFMWWIADLNLADTLMVTSVISILQLFAAVTGMFVGLRIGYMIAIGERVEPRSDGRPEGRRHLIIMCCAVGLIFGAMIADRILWRVTNIASFWSSDAPIQIASFPIRDVRQSRGSATAWIGSAGEDGLAISKYDLRFIGGPHRLQRPWRYCLNLRRQEQGNAVRVWRTRRPRLSSKAIMIVPCPGAVRWI